MNNPNLIDLTDAGWTTGEKYALDFIEDGKGYHLELTPPQTWNCLWDAGLIRSDDKLVKLRGNVYYVETMEGEDRDPMTGEIDRPTTAKPLMSVIRSLAANHPEELLEAARILYPDCIVVEDDLYHEPVPAVRVTLIDII